MLLAFFCREKDAFMDTAIYESGNTDKKNGEWKKQFGNNEPTAEQFKTKLYNILQSIASTSNKVRKWGQDLGTLIRKLYHKFGKLPVIILMDGYDSPFTEILHKRPDGSLTESEKLLLEGIKKVMEDLLGEIKSLINQQLVKLNYITGVSRLAFDSLPGSGPNNVVILKHKYMRV